jgi:hypothetical protein
VTEQPPSSRALFCPRCGFGVAASDRQCARCGFTPSAAAPVGGPVVGQQRDGHAQARVAGSDVQWPVPERNVAVGGRTLPLELVVVAGVYAFAGLWLLWTIRGLVEVLPDLISGLFADNSLEFALSYLVFFLVAIILYIAAAFLGVAYLLFRVDPLGRGLAVVVTGVLFATLVASDGEVPGWFIVVVLVAAASCAVLFLSPWVRRAMASSGRRSNRPQPVVLSQTLSVSVFSLLALIVMLYLPGLRFLDDLGAGYVFFELTYAAACALAWHSYLALRRGPDRTGRMTVTVAAGLVVMGVLFNADGFQNLLLIPMALMAGIVAPLWLAPSARQWFGDRPLSPPSR